MIILVDISTEIDQYSDPVSLCNLNDLACGFSSKI